MDESTLDTAVLIGEHETRLPRYNSRKATTSNQIKIKYKTSSVFVVCVLVCEGIRKELDCVYTVRGEPYSAAESDFITNLVYGFRFDPIRYEGEHFNRPANECFVHMRVVCMMLMQLCYGNFTQNET